MRSFPFSAVVGADDMALALILTTVSPQVGGVLVRGEKGTAKSTMVRALAEVLPSQRVVSGCRFACDPAEPDPTCPDGPHHAPCPVEPAETRPARLVELPVGASEDRIMGSLDLGKALGSGVATYEPGLLAMAHRGILYVDEVNLLHDHLVDLLLDAAAMGRATVEREGVSVSHASRLVLVGTMNPEEGELRPQLLDRFGLTVEVTAPREPQLRAEVVRRRMAFDADPGAFTERFAHAQRELRERIRSAQALLPRVTLSDTILITIARVCAGFEVDGMRADIVTARAAAAHAAWAGRTAVTRADVRAAARLALPHRRRRNPFDAPGLDEDLLDELLDDLPDPPDDDPEPQADDVANEAADDSPPQSTDDTRATPAQGEPTGASPASDPADPPRDADSQVEQTDRNRSPQMHSPDGPEETQIIGLAGVGETYRTRLLRARGTGIGDPGRRSRAYTATGRVVGSTSLPADYARGVHLPATIRAGARHQRDRGRLDGDPLRLHPVDLRRAVTEGQESNLVLLCVDASGSMAARRRMEAVKTAVLSLLMDAYQRRDKVGLITFRAGLASLDLPATSSVEIAARRLATLPHGGRTPLAEGMSLALQTLDRERLRDPRRRPLLVLVTDGHATYGPDPLGRADAAAEHVRRSGVDTVLVDCEGGRMRLGLAQRLAGRLGAQHLPVGEVGAAAIVNAVRERTARTGPPREAGAREAGFRATGPDRDGGAGLPRQRSGRDSAGTRGRVA